VSARAVLLINPRMSAPDSARLPLSLLHLGAALEEDREWRVVDGNVDPAPVQTALAALAARPHTLVGVTVMPGPQVPTAIEISAAIREAYPSLPIVWGGYFPTLYPDAAINAPYVDYVIRGQGEYTLVDLLARVDDAGPPSEADSARDISAISGVAGLTWKNAGRVVHNSERKVAPPGSFRALPYHRLGDVDTYLRPSFMGSRTAVHQIAIGCRYRCEFCGVVSMWNGKTKLDEPARVVQALTLLRDRWGADAVQFYDHNFFDRESTGIPVLEALAKVRLPWWCYARADTLAGFSHSTWEKIRLSQLRMAYIGAEAASDEALQRMHKGGARINHTLEVAVRCREYGVIPEFSFVLGGPEDPEGEVEKTFVFIRRLKELNPQCEIVLYFYSPTPQRESERDAGPSGGVRLPVLRAYGPSGPALPTTPEQWAEPRWVSWACHQDAPWLTPRLRQRVRDFARVLGCRFPTVQDYRTPAWGKAILRSLARWRYARQRYDRPWELALAHRLIPLREPKSQGL
jgi:anaerobic magnesium-protoporphyrin IX monomethyl ester cyclase